MPFLSVEDCLKKYRLSFEILIEDVIYICSKMILIEENVQRHFWDLFRLMGFRKKVSGNTAKNVFVFPGPQKDTIIVV